jgi:Flp pilus assembly protein TadD
MGRGKTKQPGIQSPAPDPGSDHANWRTPAIVAVLLLGAVLLTFSPALYAGFVRFDDPEVVAANPHIRSFSAENLRWMFTSSLLGHYHPLTWLSLALDYQLWGDSPRGYHLTNILLHAANAVLVYLLARRLVARASMDAARREVVCALGTALFALHPLRAESVAWVTERRDVLSLFFLLGAALAYVASWDRSREPAGGESRALWTGPGRGLYWLCVLLLGLSLLSKAWGVTLFAVLLILDWGVLGRLPPNPIAWLRLWPVLAEKLPMLALGIAAACMAARAQSTAHAMKSVTEWGLPQRAAQASYGLWFYIEKTLWPSKLAAMYEIPDKLDPLEPRFIFAYTSVLVLAIVAGFAGLRWRAVPAAALAYVVILLPVLGIAQSGDQLVADRYSYVASVPLILLAAAALWKLTDPANSPLIRKAVIGGASLATLTLASAAWLQAGTWDDTESLWRQAATAAPGPLTCELLGEELHLQNRDDGAMPWLQRSLDMNPENGQARYLLGLALANEGHYEAAAAAINQALKTMRQPYMGYATLGVLYANNLNDPKAAESSLRAAIDSVEQRTKSGRPPEEAASIYLAMGALLQKQGRPDEARPWLEKALAFEETRDLAARTLNELGSK